MKDCNRTSCDQVYLGSVSQYGSLRKQENNKIYITI